MSSTTKNVQDYTKEELVNVLYTYIQKAHSECRNKENPKSYFTMKDFVLIYNAYKYFKNPEDATLLPEFKDDTKNYNVLEQALNLCQMKAAFSIEDAVVVNTLLNLLSSKCQETTQAAPAQPTKLQTIVEESESSEEEDFTINC